MYEDDENLNLIVRKVQKHIAMNQIYLSQESQSVKKMFISMG